MPVAFYVTGLAKHSAHARNTGLLAAEGLVGAQIVSFVMKQAAGRLKPSDIPPGGNLRDTWFKYKGGLTNGGSFPSGHSASAFAVATVIAEKVPGTSVDTLGSLRDGHIPLAVPAARAGALSIGHLHRCGYGIQHQPLCGSEKVEPEYRCGAGSKAARL
jgi:hypothetical protein